MRYLFTLIFFSIFNFNYSQDNKVNIGSVEIFLPYISKYNECVDKKISKKYSELFQDYFLKSFSNRLVEYTNPEIDVFKKEKLNENYTIVYSLLKATEKRPEVKIDWRIYTKYPNNPLIRDLIIEGLSLARTQKEEFASILNSNNGDINALFKTLEEFSKN